MTTRGPWLDEGLAEFTANFFFGGFGRTPRRGRLNSSIYEFPNVPAPVTSTQPGSYDQTIYRKAAFFLDEMRRQMGIRRSLRPPGAVRPEPQRGYGLPVSSTGRWSPGAPRPPISLGSSRCRRSARRAFPWARRRPRSAGGFTPPADVQTHLGSHGEGIDRRHGSLPLREHHQLTDGREPQDRRRKQCTHRPEPRRRPQTDGFGKDPGHERRDQLDGHAAPGMSRRPCRAPGPRPATGGPIPR